MASSSPKPDTAMSVEGEPISPTRPKTPPFKANPRYVRLLRGELRHMREARTQPPTTWSQYQVVRQICRVSSLISRIRRDSSMLYLRQECSTEIVEFADWSSLVGHEAVKRYYGVLLKELKGQPTEEDKTELFEDWVDAGLEEQLLRLISVRPGLTDMFIRKLTETLPEEACVNHQPFFKQLSRQLCRLLLPENANNFIAMIPYLQCLTELISSSTFLPCEALVKCLEEGLGERLAELLSLHNYYDICVLECMHGIGRRLLEDCPAMAPVFWSKMWTLKVELEIGASRELGFVLKRMKEVVLGWLRVSLRLDAM